MWAANCSTTPSPPRRRFNLAADVLADAPVKLDQRRVDRGDGACPRGVDQPKDFVEVGWRRWIRGHLPGKSLFSALLGCVAHAGSLETEPRILLMELRHEAREGAIEKVGVVSGNPFAEEGEPQIDHYAGL